MGRILKLSVLVVLALASTQALALDLGRIQVKSALDQPLLAEIPVHPDHPGEASQLTVTLAPAAAFERAGIDRAALAVPLEFSVVTDADGNRFIRVTSKQPIRKSYLDFLVQVAWPQGRMLREYVVLLDPVGVTSPPSTQPATTASKTPAPAPSVQQPAPSPAPVASPASASGQGGGSYGPVTYGDTLSHIARARAIDGVSYQQMLVALKAANPDAFFRDNVNALKTGAVLRIPTRAQALSVTRTAAIAAVRTQNQAWQDAHAAPTTVAGAGGSSTPVSQSGPGASSEDRLALVSPGKSTGSNATAGGGQADATTSQLRQDLARSKEALSSQQQANADLQSRVKALEQIADKNKRLLSLKDAEIATLQTKLAEARKSAGLPALPASSLAAAVAASVAPAAMPAMAASQALATTASTGAAALPAAAGTTTAAKLATSAAGSARTKAASPAAQQTNSASPGPAPAAQGSAPWYEQLWARVVLVIILILLIIWAFLRHRKSSGGAGKADKGRKSSLADQFDDSSFGGKSGAAAAGAAAADAGVDVDGEDEDTLLTQLAEHPDNVDLHLELVGLYYDRQDVSSFEGAAEAMHAYVDDESQPEWQDVLAMGRELAPDHPLFAATVAHPAELGGHDEVGEDTADDFAVEDLGHEFELDADSPSTDFHDEFVATEHEPESGAANGLPDESEFDALPPLPEAEAGDDSLALEPESPLHPVAETDEDALDLSADAQPPADGASEDGFFDDPVDTKLDLARAYIDMGDHEGARAMLQEALHEGTQMQQDTARKLLDDLD